MRRALAASRSAELIGRVGGACGIRRRLIGHAKKLSLGEDTGGGGTSAHHGSYISRCLKGQQGPRGNLFRRRPPPPTERLRPDTRQTQEPDRLVGGGSARPSSPALRERNSSPSPPSPPSSSRLAAQTPSPSSASPFFCRNQNSNWAPRRPRPPCVGRGTQARKGCSETGRGGDTKEAGLIQTPGKEAWLVTHWEGAGLSLSPEERVARTRQRRRPPSKREAGSAAPATKRERQGEGPGASCGAPAAVPGQSAVPPRRIWTCAVSAALSPGVVGPSNPPAPPVPPSPPPSWVYRELLLLGLAVLPPFFSPVPSLPVNSRPISAGPELKGQDSPPPSRGLAAARAWLREGLSFVCRPWLMQRERLGEQLGALPSRDDPTGLPPKPAPRSVTRRWQTRGGAEGGLEEGT
ncbi:serine/arginine repetitive matrix protein 1-like [Sarcophilus harrisii]|uniref:serine/arginine repetitive matrix protein 1-like n=1 Tax=Sarcophilus harrisii TaxID=9305 RepID=UPI001301B3D6|nr:serine/arginine repetitive matrix protein 1-like [Sarcophilus harrisii]